MSSLPPVEVLVTRGPAVESRHLVDAVFASPERALRVYGDARSPVFLRSSAKPFQAAAVVAAGALEEASDEEIAIAAASHAGEDVHVAVVSRLLARLGLDAGALRCGTHPPYDAATARRLGDAAGPLHHNCSGKHAAMLALARRLGEPPERYLDPDGPGQRRILEAFAACAGVAPADVVVAVDGCGAPTFAVPLAAGARAFAVLARPAAGPPPLRAALERVASAMRRHPHRVSGTNRFDTRFAEATGGRVIVKGGAEGVEAAACPERGEGFVLKVRDGAARGGPPVVVEALLAAGWLRAAEAEALAGFRRAAVVNAVGRIVGHVEARLPGPGF